MRTREFGVTADRVVEKRVVPLVKDLFVSAAATTIVLFVQDKIKDRRTHNALLRLKERFGASPISQR